MKVDAVLVLGGSGFVGRHLVAALAARGIDVTVPTRRRERAKHLILLPTVDVVECDINEPGTIARLARGKQAIINLVGILHGRRGRLDERGRNEYGLEFAQAHVELAQAALGACRSAGVHRLLHMSALGASPRAPSEYLRSKGIAEQAVLAADDVEVTVFAPSVIFGPEDAFLNMFAGLAKVLPALVLACPDARFQPVFVGDVARAFVAALGDPAATRGKRFELAGPRVYRLKELVQYACDVCGRRRLVIGLPDWLSYLMALAMEQSPLPPLMTRDNYYSMKVPSIALEPFPFGIQPQPLEALAPSYLAPSGPRERYPQLRWRARR